MAWLCFVTGSKSSVRSSSSSKMTSLINDVSTNLCIDTHPEDSFSPCASACASLHLPFKHARIDAKTPANTAVSFRFDQCHRGAKRWHQYFARSDNLHIFFIFIKANKWLRVLFGSFGRRYPRCTQLVEQLLVLYLQIFRERWDTKIPKRALKCLRQMHVMLVGVNAQQDFFIKDSARATGGYGGGFARAEWP